MIARLRFDVIHRKIDEHYKGSVPALAERVGYDRSTVHRWLKGCLPRDEKGLLALAVALDVDPFALWDVSLEAFPDLIGRVARAIAIHGLSRFEPALSFVREFLVPGDEWPPVTVAKHYSRRWSRHEFSHRPARRRNYYATVILSPEALRPFANPQVWHFAYRDVGGRKHDFWHQYGLIIRNSASVFLYNFAGLTDMKPADTDVIVETWFGEGAADFCVASLHSFGLSVGSGTARSRAVRFTFPGAQD